MKAIRVLHVASGDGWGGSERVISLLASACVERPEVEVECVLLNEGRLASELRALGVDVQILEEAARTFPQLCRDLRRCLGDRSFDVHHVHRYKELAAIALATLPGRTRALVTIHGLEPWHQLSWRHRVQYWVCLHGAALRGVRFVAVSPELDKRLRRALPSARVRRIPNPLPDRHGAFLPSGPRARFGWSTDVRLVGWVGRLERVKGPDRLVEIARRSDAATHFVLIGVGSMEDELRTAIAQHELTDRVLFAGELPDAAVRIGELDALVLTSRHEGLPMVLLEAAACDTPVIAFDVGGVAEVVDGGQGARLIRDGDLDGFARALDEMLADTELAQHGVAWGARVRGRMGLSRTLDAYLDVYSEIRGERS